MHVCNASLKVVITFYKTAYQTGSVENWSLHFSGSQTVHHILSKFRLESNASRIPVHNRLQKEHMLGLNLTYGDHRKLVS